MTPPKSNLTQMYKTQLNSLGDILFSPEHELFYRRRNQRVKYSEVNNRLASECIVDIRTLFVTPIPVIMASWLTNCYKPFDFSNIVEYPNDLPESLKYIYLLSMETAL